ncbi:hemerythrin domain-containing protein [Micromonospora sp. NPDC005220]|uniref:hemerythrin domain-containing protein n=1 Tax=Micromonospora sp. NPDC005220 TaxID=3155589 RepID=UPI0033AA9AA3
MTTSTEQQSDGYTFMVVAHRAMVRDLQQIGDAARALATRPAPQQAQALREYATKVLALIEHHHEGEDESLWPMLTARGASPEAIALLTTEHDGLAGQVAEVQRLLAVARDDGSGFADLADATVQLRESLLVHTRDEERELAGRLRPVLGEKEWKTFQRAMVKSAPRWTLAFMPPWLASAAEPGERGAMPAPPVAWLMRGRLRRQRQAAFGEAA